VITLKRERLDDARRQEARDFLDEARRVSLPEDIVSSAGSGRLSPASFRSKVNTTWR
jgi:hypothetical protein